MNESANTETLSRNDIHKFLGHEDTLDLRLSPLDKEIAREEMELCRTHLQLNGDYVSHTIVEIKAEALDALYSAALILRNNDKNYVTGLKMDLGVNVNGITLLFRPLYMYREPSVVTDPVYTVEEGDNYIYDESAGTVVRYSPEDADLVTGAYEENIRILHGNERTFGRFIPGEDTTGIIFPFQTIFELMADNDGESVFIYNSIREKNDVSREESIKHCLLLSSGDLTSNSFKGKYANRSHLCPPSCNSVQYTILRPAHS